ncbi:MAG: NAD-binding protein [Planctomycetota bacterium]
MPDALVITAADTVEFATYDAPPLPSGMVRLKTRASCLSPGTERRVFNGVEPGMPAFPLIPGYAACVEADGKRFVSRGSQTTGPFNRCWGAHQSEHDVDPAKLIPVPDGVTDAQASFAVLAAIAFHGTFAIDRPGQRVLVIGLGVIGQCSARILHAQGHDVTAVDLSPDRVEAASAAGLDAYVGIPAAGEYNAIVDATGAPDVMRKAISLLRGEPWGQSPPTPPRYVVQGSYPTDIALPYKDVFGAEASIHFPRDSGPNDVAQVLALIQAGRLKIDDLFETRDPHDAPSIYRNGPDRPTAVFEW